MKQNELINLDNLRDTDFANLFNICQDEEGNYFYNINKGINIIGIGEIVPAFYRNYTVDYRDTWTLIAHKVYEDSSLWWLICKTLGIKDPTENPEVGTVIPVLEPGIVNSILEGIRVG